MVVGKQVADKLLEMNFWQTLPKLLKLQARKGSNKWNKVFKNGPSKICGRQPLKNLSGYGCLSKQYPFKFFKGCLLQILLGPLSQMMC